MQLESLFTVQSHHLYNASLIRLALAKTSQDLSIFAAIRAVSGISLCRARVSRRPGAKGAAALEANRGGVRTQISISSPCQLQSQPAPCASCLPAWKEPLPASRSIDDNKHGGASWQTKAGPPGPLAAEQRTISWPWEPAELQSKLHHSTIIQTHTLGPLQVSGWRTSAAR